MNNNNRFQQSRQVRSHDAILRGIEPFKDPSESVLIKRAKDDYACFQADYLLNMDLDIYLLTLTYNTKHFRQDDLKSLKRTRGSIHTKLKENEGVEAFFSSLEVHEDGRPHLHIEITTNISFNAHRFIKFSKHGNFKKHNPKADLHLLKIDDRENYKGYAGKDLEEKLRKLLKRFNLQNHIHTLYQKGA